ncbi:MAG: glycosyltransferase family 39 protein [Muribaculaceae bacterium]|nr:glycosyltransferase family 39 protein [Muribaculaceae bacterium]
MVDYNCVLYSMLISLAYFFYTPQNILFLMRMINVISMSSAIFPIYFLAKDVLKERKQAILLSGFLMIMPYMFDCAYMMQEVLSYPLFLWTLYFLYCVYGKENQKKSVLLLVVASIFSVLCVFTKTYLFFIPITLNVCSLYDIVKTRNKKKYIMDIMIYDMVYLCAFIGMYFAIYAINGFEKGSNHYTNQFSRLFPISINTIIYGMIGCIVYTAFFMVNTGIFPMGIIFQEWKSKNRSWLLRFLLISVAFMIFEIVFMIFLTEDGVGTLPHKFLFRYFQIFVPPILILFIKYKENKGFFTSYGIQAFMGGSLCVAAFYFLCMQGKTREAIMDGHLFLFIENLTNYIVPYIDVAFMLLLLIFLIWILRLYRKKENMPVMQHLIRIGIITMAFFWLIETVQLPYYTNVIAGGKQLENDSIKIAQYLNQEEYEYIYYVDDSSKNTNRYTRNFYGYIIQPYQVIAEENIDEYLDGQEMKQKTAFLFPADLKIENEQLTEVFLDTERLRLWIPFQSKLEK